MRPLALVAVLAAPAAAEDLPDAVVSFVESGVLATFYHELGHALIDLEEIPIFGQEEDAADVFSVVMTEALFDPDTALALAYDYALLFDADSRARAEAGEETPWWDVHGPDEQRFYNTVCLFYGADPDSRADYAAEMDLPEERAETCAEEFDQAWSAWGAVLDEVMDRAGPGTLSLTEPRLGIAGQVLAREVALLNEEMRLSRPLTVRTEPCGEVNAFYIPDEIAIVFCTEYEAELVAHGQEFLQ